MSSWKVITPTVARPFQHESGRGALRRHVEERPTIAAIYARKSTDQNIADKEG